MNTYNRLDANFELGKESINVSLTNIIPSLVSKSWSSLYPIQKWKIFSSFCLYPVSFWCVVCV